MEGDEGRGGWKIFWEPNCPVNFLCKLPWIGLEPAPACSTEEVSCGYTVGLQSQEPEQGGATLLGQGSGEGNEGWGAQAPGLRVASGVVKQLCLEVEENLSRKWEGSGRPPRAEEQQVPANLRRK